MGNCRESGNGHRAARRVAAPDLLGTWRGVGFSVLNWHRPVEEEGVRSRLALIRVTWDACRCQRVARERDRQTDRRTIHYIEPLHSRRGLCGHYVYEKGLCGGSWLVVLVNRSLCAALGLCHFSVTIGLFCYSICIWSDSLWRFWSYLLRSGRLALLNLPELCPITPILERNREDLDVLQNKNHLQIRIPNWSKSPGKQFIMRTTISNNMNVLV